MREIRTSGSVEGVFSNEHPYSDSDVGGACTSNPGARGEVGELRPQIGLEPRGLRYFGTGLTRLETAIPIQQNWPGNRHRRRHR
jgi:hypothetical protein